jgi:glycosyltransferase involved in cell wall biosynthesis
MVSSSYPRFSGDVIAPFIEEMAAGVAARGWETHVLLPWHPRLDSTPRRGVHLHVYRFPPFDSWGRWGYASSMVADERLHWQSYVVSLPAALSMAGTAATLVAKLKPDILHIHWAIPNGIAALAADANLPIITSLHGSDMYVAERTVWGRLVAKWVFRRSRRVTACASDLLRRAVRLGAYSQSPRLVPYGVDPHVFRPGPVTVEARKAFGLPEEAFVFLGVGRLVRKKGFHVLLDAAARLVALTEREFTIAIAGSGDLETELRMTIEALRLQGKVRLLGPVDRSRLPDLYRTADAFVLPIVRDERGNVDGLPNVLLEAMATALPVVASALAGALDVLEDGSTGLLVPSGDAQALAMAMARIAADRELARKMGAAARETVLSKCTWEKVSHTLSDIYFEALGG